MKRSRLLLFGVALLGLASFAGYESTVVVRQREQLEAAQKKSVQLRAETATVQRENATITSDLAQAESQLTELTAARVRSGTAPSRNTELATWLKQLARLRGYFDQNPAQRIPEMRLLKDEDWLRAANRADFEAEDGMRQATASIRDAAVSRYAEQLAAALRKFAPTSTADTSPNILALSPFLAPDVDPTFLSRYEMTMRPNQRGEPEWHVANKVAVDADYDTRYDYRATVGGMMAGMSSSSGVIGWTPNLFERLQQARKDFTEARNGKSPEVIADVLPFVKPPLDSVTVEKILARDAKTKK